MVAAEARGIEESPQLVRGAKLRKLGVEFRRDDHGATETRVDTSDDLWRSTGNGADVGTHGAGDGGAGEGGSGDAGRGS